jgi:hypothetical protein
MIEAGAELERLSIIGVIWCRTLKLSTRLHRPDVITCIDQRQPVSAAKQADCGVRWRRGQSKQTSLLPEELNCPASERTLHRH